MIRMKYHEKSAGVLVEHAGEQLLILDREESESLDTVMGSCVQVGDWYETAFQEAVWAYFKRVGIPVELFYHSKEEPEMSERRQAAYIAIDPERGYQYDRWVHACAEAGIQYQSDSEKSVSEWLQFIHGYYLDAVKIAAHDAGSPIMEFFRKLGALCVVCMEVHGAAGLDGPLPRSQVYDLIDSQRTQLRDHHPCGFLTMFHTYLNHAMNSWTEYGDRDALDYVRLMAGVCVDAMEMHGVPLRPEFEPPL